MFIQRHHSQARRQMRKRRPRQKNRRMQLEQLERRVVLTASLVISEFMADNSRTLDDEDGDSSDYIEVHNPTSSPIDLQGWYLTDNSDNLDKWAFPSRQILPGAYLVVFASEKDRTDPTGPLHTNFRLDTDGEYLALTHDIPDPEQAGRLITEVVHAYDQYPQQVTDVAYGIPAELATTTLVAADDAARVLIPSDDSLGTSWTEPGFPLDASWSSLTMAVGFENDPGAGQLVRVADSRTDWSLSGTQGEHNWWYGYYNKTQDADGVFQSEDFIPFPRDGRGHSATDYWNGNSYDWFQGNPPWTVIAQTDLHPNGDNNGNVHWAIRRWVSEIGGTLQVTFHHNKTNVNCGNGTTGVVMHNGQIVFSRAVGRTDTTGYTEQITINNVQPGDFIDIANLPDGTDGSQADPCDGSSNWATVDGVADVSQAVASDISAEMLNVNASAYLVLPFSVAETGGFDTFRLAMRYDAGFTAYLNGVPIVFDNSPAPETLRYDSQAFVERSDGEAVQWQEFDISSSLSLLQEGDNVLAIHGLNSSSGDTDFLISAELTTGALAVDTEDPKYFTEGTPGEANGSGTDDLGPVLSDHQHTPNSPLQSEDIIVTTEVASSFADVDSVTLHYRVMYGGESTLPMTDDGLGADQSAGDGVFTAVIPNSAYSTGQMVRWYITSADVTGTNTRFPAFPDPIDSPEYFGTMVQDPSVDSQLPVLYWFIQNPSAADNRTGTRGSVFYLDEFYDNIKTDLHGQSSGGFPKKSYDFDFNRGDRFKWQEGAGRVKDINILSNWADKAKVRNALAYEVYADSGAPHHFAFPVRIQQNGQFFATADLVEDGDDRYLERLGLDPDGALYKMYNTMTTTSHASSGAEKKARRYEDSSDLQAMLAGMLQTGQARTNFLYDNMNVPEIVNFLTGFVLTSNRDCCHKNYYVYRDSNGTGEWQILPWDVDLSFGHNWRSGPAYFDDVLYSNNGLFTGNNNGVMKAFFEIPELRQMYLRRIRTLMDDLLQPPGTPQEELKFEQRLDELLAAIDPNNDSNPFSGSDDADLDYQKWGSWNGTGANGGSGTQQTMRQAVDLLLFEFLPQRRNFLYNSQTVGRGGEIPDQQVDIASLTENQRNISFGTIDYSPASGIQDEEYIQIVNSNSFAVDISNWRITEGIEHTFIPGTVIPANGRIYLSPNVNAFRARTTGPSGGQGLFLQGNYQGHLSSFGETLNMLDAAGNPIVATTYQGNPSGAQQFLRVSEIHYNPYPPSSEELSADPSLLAGEFEFIELVNTGNEALNLEGVHFSSGISYTFPAITAQPGEPLVLVKNQSAFELRYGQGPNVAGEFESGSLSNSGEDINLEDATGSTVQQFRYNDGGDWPSRPDGNGASLEVIDTAGDYEDPANWRASTEFHGTPGGQGMGPYSDVVVNEVLTHTDPPQSDTIEIYNPTDQDIDISGWYLSDTSNEYRKFSIPSGTMLAAGGYVYFDEDDFNPSLGVAPEDFALDGAHGDDVWLIATDAQGKLARFADHVEFGGAANGEAFGRWPNGVGELYPMQSLSFGAENSGPRVGPLVISEVMYHSANEEGVDNDDLEFIEIHNPTDQAVELAGWELSGGVGYQFQPGLSLAGGAVLVVVPFDPLAPENADTLAAFRNIYSIDDSVAIVGGYDGRLNNAGDHIQLLRPDEPPIDEPDFTPLLLEDELIYSDQTPWPAGPDGGALTLHRAPALEWGNEASSWIADGPSPGTLGGRPPVVQSIVANKNLLDPPDLNGAPQPSHWDTQRSDIRTFVVTFSEPIMATAADLRIVNLGVNAPVDADTTIEVLDEQLQFADRRLTIQFGPGELPDGVYQVTVLSTVADTVGTVLGGDYTIDAARANGLFKLTGDFNSDSGVTIFDFPVFAYWFGQSVGIAPDYADMNNDGGVTIFDFPPFADNFGVSLAFPPALSATIIPSFASPLAAQRQGPAADELLEQVRLQDRAQEPWIQAQRPPEANTPRLEPSEWQRLRQKEQDLEEVIALLAEGLAQQ